MEVIEYTTNPFDGVVLEPSRLPTDPQQFQRRLDYSLGFWTDQDFKVAWLEVPIHMASLVPVAVDAGFTFHHSDDDYLMMARRLVEGAFVPAYASHYIGAGGVVVNESDEILVVRERRSRPSGSGSFKLPGGHLQQGEHLQEGVVREVLEETGIRTKFVSLASLRNQHGYRHGKSDIYFVCLLKPLSREITRQEEEIEECVWMPLSDYLGSDTASLFNKSIVRAAIENPGLAPHEIQGYRDPSTVEVFLPRNGVGPWTPGVS